VNCAARSSSCTRSLDGVSACGEVSVGAVRVGDVSNVTEYLEAPFCLLFS